MSLPHPVTIAGGGLAGLALGITLRQRGIPVTLIEAGRYPRHRVCGEFLSGRGQAVLRDFGILPSCLSGGARWAETVRFASATAWGPVRQLPERALCLSRYRMDALLADEFQRRGGQLRTAERAPDSAGRSGWIQATGRRIAPAGGAWRWFGVKAHALGVRLDADLELHFAKDAYVGLCRLDGNRVNVCGLFRRRSGEASDAVRSPLDWLRGPEGTLWGSRTARAEFDPESVCTTGGLDLRMHPPIPSDRILLGDALAIIPPLSGNGMSLALESAQRAAGPVAGFADGTISWLEACNAVQREHRRAFRRRLIWAGVLQRLLFAPVAPALLFRLLHRSDAAWRILFAATRG